MTQTPPGGLKQDLNAHVEAVLASYLAKPPFGALLIAGEWGSGKTYIVKRSRALLEASAVYISANGVSSIDELRKRILYSAFPVMGDKTVRALGSIAASALGMLRFNLKLNLGDLVQLDSVRCLIIDDVERMTLGIEESLGFFNGLCEHEGKHVILVGDYQQLELKGSFKNIREKTIGKTIKVYADFVAGVSSIENDVEPHYHKLLLSKTELIADIFDKLGSSNLRIMKQIAYEFEDLYPYVATDWMPREKLEKAFRQFWILSLAWKMGVISKEDLVSRSQYRYAGLFDSGNAEARTPIQQLAHIFSNDDVFHLYWDTEFLGTKICDGLTSIDSLERGIADLRSQSDLNSHPEWRILWHYLDHDSPTIEAAYRRFRTRFHAREYRDSGVILHSFGIAIEMQRAKVDRRSLQSVMSECKRYIDDLYKKGELPALSDDLRGDWRYGSAHGLGFMNIETQEFSSLLKHYRSQSAKLRSQNLIQNLKAVLDDLDTSVSLFEAIVSDFSHPNSVLRDPLLSSVPSAKVANAVLKCSGSSQGSILRALGQRYYNNPDLVQKEGSWLLGLVKALQRRASKEPAPTPFRITKLIELSLGNAIQQIEDAQSSTAKSRIPSEAA